MRQQIDYTNPKAGKFSMTLGTLAKGVGYVAGAAAITGLIFKNQDLGSVQPDYLQGFLEDLVNRRDALFTTSVIGHTSGAIMRGIGRWKNWRKTILKHLMGRMIRQQGLISLHGLRKENKYESFCDRSCEM